MTGHPTALSRRQFLTAAAFVTAYAVADPAWASPPVLTELAHQPVSLSHFPSTLHAFIWRNWNLVPIERLALVLDTNQAALQKLASAMGLPPVQPVSTDQLKRSYLTIIRRNWHLLPREQLLTLLNWSDEKLTFTLQEDDFFYIKLGSLKPDCKPITFTEASPETKAREKQLARWIRDEFPAGFPIHREPLFQFVNDLSQPPETKAVPASAGSAPRFGYAYFALFGDPLLETDIDPYPEGYLDQMAAAGMNGTWMHIVLSKITPFPWDHTLSEQWEQRLENLHTLVKKARRHGIGMYLYLNEPRFLPLAFFDKHPELKGVPFGQQAALCTSHPAVQQYLADSIALIVNRIPDLAGFFSITASENYTNCWSHGKGADCPRCSKRSPSEVIAELNQLYMTGIQRGMSAHKTAHQPQLIVWDWGWKTGFAEDIIPKLPKEAALMSVSEWELPIERGGIKNTVGEYSISSIGPGPRASRHWDLARRNGLKTIAKIQANNTWELAAVPYIPALENVANHAKNLRNSGVEGLMLGWTLCGYPSPNLEVVAEMGSRPTIEPLEAMQNVARRRFGPAAGAVTEAWRQFSRAFSEFPYHVGVVYNAPLQVGPANLLWPEPTGYKASMVGLAYDDLKNWRSNYPAGVFIDQLEKVASGFTQALEKLRHETVSLRLTPRQKQRLAGECRVAETVAVHYSSLALQARFIQLRDQLGAANQPTPDWQEKVLALENILKKEIRLARQMAALQGQDSRLGFEASNHYFYVCNDLAEKVINCHDLLENWLPALKKTLLKNDR
ncbi:hypothetical protein ACFPMF_09100 [Larkinella bovis]|uniref:Beta-hexosaminidase bacterial type N-terminal domain-containing protein n=1 Tax=Larkinella bovis TaxID=683041 RepID=A0ABW0IDQ1_9BACT